MKKQITIIMITLFVVFSFSSLAIADNDARDYVAAPPGTTVMAVYYNHTTGYEAYSKGEKVGEDTNLAANIGILRPIHFTKLGPFTIDPQALIIFGDQTLDGADVGGTALSTSGFADPIVAATCWFVNNPDTKTWLGFTPFITMPLGDYDEERALNLGANRWAFKAELGFVKGFGDFFFDLTGNVEFYTDNDEYTAEDLTLEQDPMYTLETHLSYNFTDSFFVSADYYWHKGGETTVADIARDDEADDHAAQLTLGYMLSPSFQLLIKYRENFEVENGPKTNTFGIRLMHFF